MVLHPGIPDNRGLLKPRAVSGGSGGHGSSRPFRNITPARGEGGIFVPNVGMNANPSRFYPHPEVREETSQIT